MRAAQPGVAGPGASGASSAKLTKVIAHAIDIGAPASQVWDFVSDLENYARWFPGIEMMTRADGDETGARFDEIARLPNGKTVDIQARIITQNAPTLLQFEANLAPALPRFTLSLTPTGPKTTRLAWTCEARGKGPAAQFSVLLMRAVLNARGRQALANLKRILEGAPHSLMRAVELRRFGSSSVLRLTDRAIRPRPGPGEVLVKVEASALNPIDVRRRSGYGATVFGRGQPGLPIILGVDFAGTVAALGSGSNSFAPGERVFGAISPGKSGSHADFLCVPKGALIRSPPGFSASSLAAMPYAFLTAWNAVVTQGRLERMRKGARVLVQGAAGSVGSAALQIAHSLGAELVALVMPGQEERARLPGVRAVLTNTAEANTLDPNSLDLVVATADPTLEGALSGKIRRGGAFVTTIHPTLALIDSHGIPKGVFRARAELRLRNQRARELGYRHAWAVFRQDAAAREALLRLLSEGRLPGSPTFAIRLEDLPRAHEMVEAGSADGKFVIQL